MQLQLLRDGLDQFADSLNQGYDTGLAALYESIQPWQQVWPPATPSDLAKTLEDALHNTRSRSYWQGHAYQPKEVLVTLARANPEGVNLAFGRLFNRSLSLGERYSGFVYYLDEMLREWQRDQGPQAAQIHHHDDYRAPSLYCALRFPEEDAYFESEVYAAALRKLRAPNVSPAPDPDRFEKTVRVIGNFMDKHESLQAAHARRLTNADYSKTCRLLVSEFLRYLAQQ